MENIKLMFIYVYVLHIKLQKKNILCFTKIATVLRISYRLIRNNSNQL